MTSVAHREMKKRSFVLTTSKLIFKIARESEWQKNDKSGIIITGELSFALKESWGAVLNLENEAVDFSLGIEVVQKGCSFLNQKFLPLGGEKKCFSSKTFYFSPFEETFESKTRVHAFKGLVCM